MKLKEHIIYGGIVSATLYPFAGWKSVFFFGGSVCIDIDHYIDFLYYSGFKNWKIKDMFKFHGETNRLCTHPNIYCLQAFHTLEFVILLFLLGINFKSSAILLIFSGMIFHWFLDLISMYKRRIIRVRALSFTGYWIKSNKMKRLGIHPEQIFREAYTLSQSQR